MKFLSEVDLREGSRIGGKVIARKDEIPTSLPANGGDSNTVGGLNPSQFLRSDTYDIQSGGIQFSSGISLYGSSAYDTNAVGAIFYSSTLNEFRGNTNGVWGKFWTESNFNPNNYYSKNDLNTSGGIGQVHWDRLTNKPTTFEPSSHDHDDRYVNVTGDVMTGALKIQTNSAGTIFNLEQNSEQPFDFRMGHGTYNYRFRFTGNESGNNNSLELWTSNADADINKVFRVQQDGVLRVEQLGATIAGNTVYHTGNLPSYEPRNTNIQSHIASTNNPHNVTKSQVGLGSVDNFGTASQTEAQAGTNNDKFMTPLRVKEAISSHQSVSSVAGRTGSVTLSKSDVGLSSVENKSSATIRGEITSSNVTTALGYSPENPANKNKSNGYAGLDSSGKILLSVIPDTARQQTHVVTNSTERNALTGLVSGDRAFETSTGDSYIWDGTTWMLQADADWANVNIEWGNILNKPSSSVASIDEAVNFRHTHNNKSILDAITSIPEPAFSILGVSKGGTGLSSVTAGRILFGNGTSALNNSANLTYLSDILSSPYIKAFGTSRTAGAFYGGTNSPVSTNRTNYDGHFYATKLYSGNTEVSIDGHNHDDRYFTETELKTSGGGGQVHWNNITNAPTDFNPTAHNHDERYYTETEIDTNIYTKTQLNTSGGGGQVHWNNVTSKPSTYTPSAHNHDDRYYTETELNTSGAGGAVHWNNVTNKPTTYTPSTHNHDSDYLKLDGSNKISVINGTYGEMIRSTDEWLRINDDESHTLGVYLGTNIVRTDGTLQVGEGGSGFMATSGGVVTASTSMSAPTVKTDSVEVKGKMKMEWNELEQSLDFVYVG